MPNSLVKIDPDTGKIVDVFRVGREPFMPAIVGDYVFVASGENETLSRIDTRSGELDTLGGLPSPAGVAAGSGGTLWVGSDEGNELRQLDADTYQLQRLAKVPRGSAGPYVAVGGGSVWVSQGFAEAVSRFDARTGRFQRRYPHAAQVRGGAYSAEVAFGEGAAWTAVNGFRGGRMLRIDALGGGSEQIEVGEIPFAVAVDFGAVWLTDHVAIPTANAAPEAGLVIRLDPATGTLEDVIPVGKRPSGVATGGGAVWVANGGERTISKIDPNTNQIVDTLPTTYYPYSLAYGHGHLWVSLHPEPFAF
jgi:DNA-binding beta-propeller fold protein YncE